MVFGLTHSILKARGKKNAIIAEIKVYSPKDGDLLRGRDPIEILRDYHRAGAVGISYITERKYFRGDFKLFREICEESSLPVLRKDFIVNKEEIERTAEVGASAVLLIARKLKTKLPEFADVAREHGLEPLIEIHELNELRYIESLNHGVIGINNRDIEKLEKDGGNVKITEKIAPFLPKRFLKISESGIRNIEDLKRALLYTDAALIGTALMLSSHPGEKLKEFVEA